MAVEGITGLKINYWAMVNLRGLQGPRRRRRRRRRCNVRAAGSRWAASASDVTGYIEPGVRKLNGHDTLWFARAREGSDDYSRMARQKCVMGAMLQQISPQTMRHATSQDIAKASTGDGLDQHPAGEVGRFMDLALKAKRPEGRRRSRSCRR